MRQKKGLFLYWAFLDLERTGDRSKTYFALFAEEIRDKNLSLIRTLSLCLSIISVLVILVCATIFPTPWLRDLYIGVLALELISYTVSTVLIRTRSSGRFNSVLTVAYVAHILVIAGMIGTVFSPTDSAAIFLVALVVSQIVFILPPLHTLVLSSVACVGTLVASSVFKRPPYVQIDILNCVCVLVLSTLLNWNVSHMRAEEAFTRAHMKRLNNELKRLQDTDLLTSLPNHQGFRDAYAALYRAAQCAGLRIGVLLLDIDRFKSYNQQYGFTAGDRALERIAQMLSARKDGDLYVCRFGGEDFLVLIKDADCDRAEAIAEELRLAVERLAIPHETSGVAGVLTVSVGLCVETPQESGALMEPVDKADRAMHKSKADGGNRVTVCS